MSNVVSFPAQTPPTPPLTVVVTFSDGFYTAECSALHLVAEAQSLDALTEVTWSLVPELIELNALPLDVSTLRLRFDVLESTRCWVEYNPTYQCRDSKIIAASARI